MKIVMALLGTAAFLLTNGCSGSKDQPVTLETLNDKASYGIGVQIGKGFKQQGLELNLNAVRKGIDDAVAGGELKLSDKEFSETMQAFQSDMRAKSMEGKKKASGKNKKEGEAFLAKNKQESGVITTASGLQYTIIKKGTGKTPKPENQVECHYRGTLIDGTEFDSSYKRGAPATFPVTGVIKGWTEALQLMKVGAKWKLFIPSELAYGPQGAGAQIGPHATLIFDIELLAIK